jgi:hypothetical protein
MDGRGGSADEELPPPPTSAPTPLPSGAVGRTGSADARAFDYGGRTRAADDEAARVYGRGSGSADYDGAPRWGDSLRSGIGRTTSTEPTADYDWREWAEPKEVRRRIRTQQTFATIRRVIVPSIVCTILGVLYFDNITAFVMRSLDAGGLVMVMQDESQFIQNFLTVIGLLFSILAGNAYSSLYTQQETIYFALFNEVSEAKSLLEQMTLVCQGRPFYPAVLAQFELYVSQDLRRLDLPPAYLLSSRPAEDPLEAIMFMTSVGVPSVIYETVKSLRQARGHRLGACQRKFPSLGIALLYVLAILELVAFPLLGAGTATVSNRVLNLQSSLFGLLCGALVMVLRVIQELRLSSGGVFTVDLVLRQMVSGLEAELEQRRRATGGFMGTGGAFGAQMHATQSASAGGGPGGGLPGPQGYSAWPPPPFFPFPQSYYSPPAGQDGPGVVSPYAAPPAADAAATAVRPPTEEQAAASQSETQGMASATGGALPSADRHDRPPTAGAANAHDDGARQRRPWRRWARRDADGSGTDVSASSDSGGGQGRRAWRRIVSTCASAAAAALALIDM